MLWQATHRSAGRVWTQIVLSNDSKISTCSGPLFHKDDQFANRSNMQFEKTIIEENWLLQNNFFFIRSTGRLSEQL